ncbi:MAG TPA: asparagine synthase (glutamine-hydrolyzing) [Bacilli bacterium]|nr:asparagine synthase (glutamine-hydrolyzing) [Bacilli bacterium]
MCGFVGFVDKNIKDRKNVIKDMNDTIIHRGPDDEGYYVDDNVALGFRRLSIIDLSTGKQPIYNEDNNLVLVYNGEIYNYKDIREDLVKKGHVFKTNSDSEVLIHGYEEYKEHILDLLRGMYAFVIWDKSTNELFGARDIFGIKPFYYYYDNNTLLFASEIKAMLKNPNFKKELNEEMIPYYLMFEYIPNENTLFKNVKKLLPGEYFIYKDNKLIINKYFDIKYNIDNTKSHDEWVNIIIKTFEDSVKAHKISDVEVGAFLSSGIDSSYTVKELAKINKIKTFSIGYAEKKYSELEGAEEFAKEEKLEQIITLLNEKDYFSSFKKIQWHMDEPLPNPSAVPLYHLANCASKYVKVVLSGEGADELFGGYEWYQDPFRYEKYMKIPKLVRTIFSIAASLIPKFHGKTFIIKGRKDAQGRYVRQEYVFNYKETKNILNRSNFNHPSTLVKKHFDKVKNLDDITKIEYVDIMTWLPYDILQKADKMSMANSIELRVPFLDRKMLEVAMQMPVNERVTRNTTKIALRDAAAKEINNKTAYRRKIGFTVPLNEWIKKDEYYNMIRNDFESEIAGKYFNQKLILKLLDDHKLGTLFSTKKIWTIWTFLVWYKIFFIENKS